MTINLDLKPEIEAGLKAQAQVAGLSLPQFLQWKLEAMAPAASAQPPEMAADGSDQWEKELDE